MNRASAVSLTLVSCLFFSACGKKEEASKEQAAPIQVAPPASAAVATSGAGEAQKYFKSRCGVCHGPTGAGDGPGAAALDPKPRAFADAAWQEGISDEELAKVITDGGVSVGKSPGMPAHPDLKAKPELLKELVALIRGFNKT